MDSVAVPPSNPTRSSNSKAYLFGALGCIVGFLAGVGLCSISSVLGLSWASTNFGAAPTNLAVDYDMPATVALGEEFDLVLTLSNTGDTDFSVGDIDVDEVFGGSILDGADVISTDPQMDLDDSIPGVTTFLYNRAIPAGESRTVIFHLRAAKVGTHVGTVGIYVSDKAQRVGPLRLTVTQ